MTRNETRARAIVFATFVTLFFIGGVINVSGVFVIPLSNQFGWSRVRVSSLVSVAAFAAAASSPIAGWLIDRIEARIIMVIGAALAGCGMLLLSAADSFNLMLTGYLVFGLGLGMAGLTACATVVANWFDERRGLALGMTVSGTAAGGMLLTLIVQATITRSGWRAAYFIIGLAPLVIVVPVVWLLIRSRPDSVERHGAGGSFALPGYEMGEALRVSSFWLLSAARFTSAIAIGGIVVHLVPALIGMGYSTGHAAVMQSVLLGLSTIGKPVFGLVADRISGRRALALDLFLIGLGVMLLPALRDVRLMLPFIVTFGPAAGAPLALVPTAFAEAMGIRRLGSLLGLEGVLAASGLAFGPIIAGRIFDLRGGYGLAFEAFAALAMIGAVAALLAVPFEERSALIESSRRLEDESWDKIF